MRTGVVLIALMLCSCASGSDNGQFSDAQRLVDQVVANRPMLVRLTIHAVPAGETESRIIACNLSEKIGQPSDPEDLSVMATGLAVVLREGGNLDVTMPIPDKTGKIVAATGVTLAGDGRSEEALMREAHEIAHEVTAGIQESKRLPW